MAQSEKKQPEVDKLPILYWCRSNANFGKSIKFGDPLPETTDLNTRTYLLSKGWVSETKPASFNAAKATELEQAKKELVSKDNKIADLERKISLYSAENVEAKALKAKMADFEKLVAENEDLKEQVSELQDELSDFKPNVKEANKKIKALEKQLEELTKPE